MKRASRLLWAAPVLTVLFCATALLAQNAVPEIAYDSAANFLKLPDGLYLGEAVGVRGTEPLQFNTPHSIQVDARGNVFVADRNNGRIQVLDNNLVLRAIYDNVGRPWAVCITPGPHQYLYSSNSNPDNGNNELAAVTGEIYKMELDGTIVGKFGVAGKELGKFQTVHAIDCKNENELLVAEIIAWRVQKIILQPKPTTTSSR